MSKQDIINKIINNEDTDYAAYGKNFLNISDASRAETQAKAVERECLNNIANLNANPGGDLNVLKAIAKYDFNKNSSDDSSDQKRLKLYVLQHRSGYAINVDGKGSTEVCCLGSGAYYTILKGGLSKLDEAPASLKTYYDNGYYPINTTNSIYYTAEKNKFIGKNSSYTFSYSTDTAAVLYGDPLVKNNQEPIVYSGYTYESQDGRTNYASGGSQRKNQFFYLTPGGGPITEDNWVIKYVEYDVRTVVPDDKGSSSASSWVFDGECIVKIWIHFFFPDGCYCRTTLDRSDNADFSDKPSSDMATSWIYSDYSSCPTGGAQKTFKTVWNLIQSKALYPAGGYDPDVIDISLNWNGKLDSGLQKKQVAYQKGGNHVWYSGGIRS